MDPADMRARPQWYGGRVVARAEAIDEHTVLFEDGPAGASALLPWRRGDAGTWRRGRCRSIVAGRRAD
eukprot:5537180-Prymnesium_polylepis.1